jgi:hypothetical protein
MVMFVCRSFFRLRKHDPTRLLSYHTGRFQDDDKSTVCDPTQRLVSLAQPKLPFLTVTQPPAGSVMNLSITAGTVLVAIAASSIAYLLNVWHTWRQLSHVPGPFWAGFTKLWMVRQSFRRRQPYAIMEANNTYGTVAPAALYYPAYMFLRLADTRWTERGHHQRS